ncbi:MAG TPA: hypothetical protein ENJ45_00195 [Phaeodactylibacter sp.]|nr:hypothetical protein [Phaeodactylibacter sp.]
MYNKGTHSVTHLSAAKTFSFQLNGGLIFFEAMLNGQLDTFVLDTGSPGLLLNEPIDLECESNYSAVGVNSDLTFQKKKGHRFQVANVVKKNLSSLSINMEHLEKLKNQKFKGMVGQRIFATHELLLDYKTNRISLLNGGQKERVENAQRTEAIPIEQQQHFAVIKIKIGKRSYNFGIDTGAEVNIIDDDLAHRLSPKKFKKTKKIKIRGVSQQGSHAQVGEITEVAFGSQTLNDLPFVAMDMRTLNKGKGMKLDGLLGYPFLSSGLFSIDYIAKKFYIWSRVIEQDRTPPTPLLTQEN